MKIYGIFLNACFFHDSILLVFSINISENNKILVLSKIYSKKQVKKAVYRKVFMHYNEE